MKNEFKVGDMVAVMRSGYSNERIAKINVPITRETKQYVEADGVLYKKDNGMVKGAGSWTYTYIEPMTEDIRKRYKRLVMREQIERFIDSNRHLTMEDEDLEAICGIIKKYPS